MRMQIYMHAYAYARNFSVRKTMISKQKKPKLKSLLRIKKSTHIYAVHAEQRIDLQSLQPPCPKLQFKA